MRAWLQRRGAAPLERAVRAQRAADHAAARVDHRRRRAVAGARRVPRRHADLRDRVPLPGRGGHQAVPRRAAGPVLRHRRHDARPRAWSRRSSGWCSALFALLVLRQVRADRRARRAPSAPTPGTALRVGLALAQGGEFGFVLLPLAGAAGIVPAAAAAGAARRDDAVDARHAVPHRRAATGSCCACRARNGCSAPSSCTASRCSRSRPRSHVIVFGYGRNGQRLARLLDAEGVRYVALDLDPERVREAAAAGDTVVFADASRREALIAAGISRAAAVVRHLRRYAAAAMRVLAHVHELNPARAGDRARARRSRHRAAHRRRRGRGGARGVRVRR